MEPNTRRALLGLGLGLGLGLVLAGVLVLILAGCGPSGIGGIFGGLPNWLGGSGASEACNAKGGAKPGLLGARQEFADFLGGLQRWSIILGLVALVASFWIPLISTRHAVGALVVGVGIAFAKPFLIAAYWPFVGLCVVGIVVFAWPYGLAGFSWARARITGRPIDPAKLTTGLASLATLWKPRSAVLADSRRADISLGVDGVSTPPTNGGAS